MKLQKAFTMMEMLVVIFIIGLIASFVGPKVAKYMGAGDKMKITFKMTNIKDALTTYKMEMGDYPTQREGLKALIENPRPNDERYRAKGGKWPFLTGGEDEISHNGIPFIYNRPPARNKSLHYFEIIYPGTSGDENDPESVVEGA
jgi:general secretion pathway protein G